MNWDFQSILEPQTPLLCICFHSEMQFMIPFFDSCNFRSIVYKTNLNLNSMLKFVICTCHIKCVAFRSIWMYIFTCASAEKFLCLNICIKRMRKTECTWAYFLCSERYLWRSIYRILCCIFNPICLWKNESKQLLLKFYWKNKIKNIAMS